MGLLGCAGTGPDVPTGPSPGTAASNSASPTDSVQGHDSSGDASSERTLQSLRAAYIDGAYKKVARRARAWRQDSLDAATSVRVNALLGRAEQAQGNHTAAIEALRRARVAASKEGRSLVAIDRALGESYGALYRWRQAASAFRRVLDAQPEDRAIRQALAEVYRQSRQWGKAQNQYRQLVRADSSNGQWWARLAQCSLEQNAQDRARRHFAEAHRRLPQSADVALSLSRLYRADGQMKTARQVVDTTLSRQLGDPRLWRRKADLAFQQNHLDQARGAYRRTIATGDSSATAYRRIGLIDVRREQYRQALPFFRRALHRDSSHTRTTLYLGIVYLKLDSLQRATTYLQRTVNREAQGPITPAFKQLGTVYSQRGKVTDAIDAYTTALRLRPEQGVVYFRMATTYDEHYRDKRPAARYYRRFLQVTHAPPLDLRRYAKKRLDALQPTLHMQEGEADRRN